MSTPQLTNRAEFEAALHNYHISAAAHDVLATVPFVLMLAASASGRNTIINELVKTGHYYFTVSDTTRPPRSNNGVLERDGVEYFFRSEDEVLKDIQSGRYIEAEIIHEQQVSGTSIRELEKARAQNKIAITEVDLGGTVNIARLKPDVKIFFIAPPSFAEWLRRIKGRNSPSDEEIARRMATALAIFKAALQDDRFIFIINDDLPKAVQAVDQAVRFGVVDAAAQSHARAITRQLLKETEAYSKARK